jgi:hypothetical protein
MAEETHSGPVELGAPMDYDAHRSTFAGFVTLTKTTILSTVIVLIALALYGFGRGGFWLGTVLVILTLIGAALSLIGNGTLKPLVAVAIVGVIFAVLSLS